MRTPGLIPYVLADDLTGALETGSAFRRQGWPVEVPLVEGAVRYGADRLTVITTESRNLSGPESAAAVRRAASAAKAAGATLLFKKIDSTLRGPVQAELAALGETVGTSLIVFCPANPSAGRVVRDGVLYVHGVPLAETAFRDDPHWPARSSVVADFLGGAGGDKVVPVPLQEVRDPGWGNRIEQLAASGAGLILVCDAAVDDDLERLALGVRPAAPRILLAGSSALGAAMARHHPLPGPALPAGQGQSPFKAASMLVLCGTRHPASSRQIAHLVKHRGAVRLDFRCGQSDATAMCERIAAVLEKGGIAAVIFQGPDGDPGSAARRISMDVAALARPLFDRFPDTVFCLTGGATAREACGAAGGTRLDVLGEITPGLVAAELLLTGGSTRRRVVTKPGGYGTDDIFSSVWDHCT